MTTYKVVIEHDDNHRDYVLYDLERETDPGTLDMRREELENLDNGTWTAYAVSVNELCDCCGQVARHRVAGLSGCVVASDSEAGTYDSQAGIADDYLREVAGGLLMEAKLGAES